MSVMTRADRTAEKMARPAPIMAVVFSPPAISMPPSPGRRMTRTPMKPTMVAVQRRARTTSWRMTAAPIVANSGTVKLRAMALVERHHGQRSPVKPQSMERRLRKERQV